MERLKERYAAAVTAVGGWCGRNTVIIVSAVVIGLIAAAVFFGGPLIMRGVSQALVAYDAITDHKEKVEAFSKLATALGLLVAAPFALLGVGLAFWRTWNQHRDTELATRKLETESELAARKLDAEAFAKAVEQLGHAEIAIRMGAALALQNLAKASPCRLLGQTLEILCAYVREKRPRTKEADQQPAVPLPTDVKLILQVISRLNLLNADGKSPVDLSNTDLRGINLIDTCLRYTDFSNSNLTEANFFSSNLKFVYFKNTNLKFVQFSFSDLSNMTLEDSDLLNVNFSGADLTNVSLSKINLEGVNFGCSIMIDMSLIDLNLRNAHLGYADLRGARLRNVDLQGAFLYNSNLLGARLQNVNLRGAELQGAKLEGVSFADTILD